MRHKAVLSFVLFALASGCASAPADEGRNKVDPALEQYVLPSVPADVKNRTLVDFGGAVHLVGWELEPADQAKPGSRLKLKLYWRSVKRLSPGWSLFTHLIAPGAPLPYAFDGEGPLRQNVQDPKLGTKQKLSPSDWLPGNVYVDEQEFTVPPDISAPEVTLAVGLYREALQVVGQEVEGLTGVRLPVVSGLSDGEHRAVLAQLATGVRPGQKKSPAPQRPGGKPRLRDPRPGAAGPRGAPDLARANAPSPGRPAGTDSKETP
jgi:hypothetical protein